MAEILSARNISKSYKDNIALNDVSLNLNRGEIHALLGPNGAGKTTLVKIIATLIAKDSGQVEIMGYDIDSNPNEIRHFIGYVGQDTERSAYARLTPRENLRFFGALRGLSKDEVDDKIGRYEEAFDFNGILEKQFMHLSGGNKQKVVILRALLHDPPLIYLDEPTKGLDPLSANSIRKFMKKLVADNRSMILTSHIMPEVDYLADRCSLISQGKIFITDTPKALKNSIGASEFIELKASNLPGTTRDRIENLDTVVSCIEKGDKDDLWVSFGVADIFDSTEQILGILREDGVRTGFRHHTISLEDAFIHHIGSQFRDEVK